MNKISDPAQIKTAQGRRAALEKRHREARTELEQRQAAAQKQQKERADRQKETTAHYFKTRDGKQQLRGNVRGEYAGRTDRQVASHGFNAGSKGPVEKERLEEAHRRQSERQHEMQKRERLRREQLEAQKRQLKGRAKKDFERSR